MLLKLGTCCPSASIYLVFKVAFVQIIGMCVSVSLSTPKAINNEWDDVV